METQIDLHHRKKIFLIIKHMVVAMDRGQQDNVEFYDRKFTEALHDLRKVVKDAGRDPWVQACDACRQSCMGPYNEIAKLDFADCLADAKKRFKHIKV